MDDSDEELVVGRPLNRNVAHINNDLEGFYDEDSSDSERELIVGHARPRPSDIDSGEDNNNKLVFNFHVKYYRHTHLHTHLHNVWYLL